MAAPKKKTKTGWVEKMKADAKSPKKATPKNFGKWNMSVEDWKAVAKDSPIHGPDYGVGENPEAPRFNSDKGVGKNPRAPRVKAAPKLLTYRYDTPQKRSPNPNINRANPPEKINLPDRSPFTNKLKPQAAPSTAKPEGTGRFTSKLAGNRGAPKDLGVGKNPMAPRAAKAAAPAAKAAGIGSKIAKGLSVGSKLLGRANPIIGQITSAMPAGAGSDKPSGPLMKGNAASKRQAAGTYTKSYDKPSPESNYRGPNRGLSQRKAPAAPASGPGTSYPAPSAAPAQSTSTFPGSKGSTKDSVASPGTQTKRGAVTTAQSPAPAPTRKLESRYQRDSGLAMNSRKKK